MTSPDPAPGESAGELVQATIEVPDLVSVTAQAEVLTAVQSQPGVKTVHQLEKDVLHIVYDPLLVTEHELEEVVRRSGHRPEHGQAERDSPFAIDKSESQRLE